MMGAKHNQSGRKDLRAMFPMRIHTMSSVAIACGLMILWMLGCEQPETMTSSDPVAGTSALASAEARSPGASAAQPAGERAQLVEVGMANKSDPPRGLPHQRDERAAQPARATGEAEADSEGNARTDSAEETGEPDDAEESPSVNTTADASVTPRQVDPGAEAFLQALRTDLASNPAVGEPPLRIRLGRICNMSRASSDEYLQFRNRLATMLSHAGAEHQISFTTDPDADAAWQLRGSAYLIMANGFDWWELHLRLVSADDAGIIWQAQAPLRVIRRPRTIGQQMFFMDRR